MHRQYSPCALRRRSAYDGFSIGCILFFRLVSMPESYLLLTQLAMSELHPNDQKKVDHFLGSNVNAVERKPFSPLRLLAVIVVVLVALTAIAYWIAFHHGVV